MIWIQKIYGFHGISHQDFEKVVTNGWRMNGQWKIEQFSGRPWTAKTGKYSIENKLKFKKGLSILLTPSKVMKREINYQKAQKTRSVKMTRCSPQFPLKGKKWRIVSKLDWLAIHNDASIFVQGRSLNLALNVNLKIWRKEWKNTTFVSNKATN